MSSGSRTSARVGSLRQANTTTSEGSEPPASGSEAKDEFAAHVLVSMSEASSADLQNVNVETLDPKGKVSL